MDVTYYMHTYISGFVLITLYNNFTSYEVSIIWLWMLLLSLECSYVHQHHELQKNPTTECCLETDSGSHARQISLH